MHDVHTKFHENRLITLMFVIRQDTCRLLIRFQRRNTMASSEPFNYSSVFTISIQEKQAAKFFAW
jgi:hypothetical protein